MKKAQGFTLIELIAGMAILVVLAGLGFSAIRGGKERAAMVKEIRAGKNLISAYMAAAAERNGEFLAGLDDTAGDVIMRRYPYRLAPYFSDELEGTILVNENLAKVGDPAAPGQRYLVSTIPTFAINHQLVGGHILQSKSGARNLYAADCISRVAQSKGSIIAFVTAGAARPGDPNHLPGFCYAYSPMLGGWQYRDWADFNDPSMFGYVHPKHDNKALCAFLDGSVRAHTIEELQDMRLWSYRAAELDKAQYIPQITR